MDDIVIAKRHKTISLVFDYPLEKEVVFDLESPDGGGFTRGQLVSAIANKYKQIYKVNSSGKVHSLGALLC